MPDINLNPVRFVDRGSHISPIIIQVNYRPFDIRHSIYSNKSQGVLWRPRGAVLASLNKSNNFGLISKRSRLLGGSFEYRHTSITNCIMDKNFLADQSFVFPIYLYPEESKQQDLGECSERKPNFDAEIVDAIAKGLGLAFVPEKISDKDTFAPIDLLDYIYAVLHSPSYRETYKEFLKIDFPRIPYPKDAEKFWALVKLGGELRSIHLLESPAVENYITSYPKDGDNIVTRKSTKKDWELYDAENGLGRIWINDDQYFDQIPLTAWEFYIGGYQPAQKWLKDRSGRKLSFDDILHYQKIIVALSETHRIMQNIDKIEL